MGDPVPPMFFLRDLDGNQVPDYPELEPKSRGAGEGLHQRCAR